MQSPIERQQQLKKLGVDTAPLSAVQAKSAVVVMILVGIVLISDTAPAKQSGLLAASDQGPVKKTREVTLQQCQTQADTIKVGMNVAAQCKLTKGESATSVSADNSKAYIGYPNFFAIRNQAKDMTAAATGSSSISSKP
jgi:hypothetical protein